MNAPPECMSPEEFNRVSKQMFEERYKPNEKMDGAVCKTCGAEIMQTTMYVSVHDKLWGGKCAGSGECKQIPLPYCPKCEGIPTQTSTCVHV